MRSAFIRCHCGAATGARRDLLLPVCRGSRFVVPGLSGLTRVRLQADPFGGDSEFKTHWLVALFTTVQFCPSATMDVPVLANEVLSTTLLGQLARIPMFTLPVTVLPITLPFRAKIPRKPLREIALPDATPPLVRKIP